MIKFLTKLKIPTLLGLSLIILGIGSGVYLVLQQQTLTSQASPNLTPQNMTISNIEDKTVTISWDSTTKITGFVSYWEEGGSQKTTLDEKDQNVPSEHLLHFVVLKSLIPQTNYNFTITSGQKVSSTLKFKTAKTSSRKNSQQPILGSVLDGDKPLSEGIVYLEIPEAATASAQIKNLGSFVIPLNSLRKIDLSDLFEFTVNTIGKLKVFSPDGRQSNITLNLSNLKGPIGPLVLGQDLDLTATKISSASAIPSSKPSKPNFDLNGDGYINVSDYATVLQNFGKSTKKADLNDDGIVNQKDLDLISKQVYKPVSQQ